MWILFTLLSVFFWALLNVLDSSLVHRFEKHPLALMWCQSFFSIPSIIVLSFFLPLDTPWIPLLIACGAFAFLGDVWFFRVLEHMDVSVVNVAWSFLSLLLAVVGFFLFREQWGSMQTLGAVFIVAGTFFVSFYHHRIDFYRVLKLVTVLALMYLPFYVAKKWVIDVGENPVTVFFWMMVGRESLGFSVPPMIRSVRITALRAVQSSKSFMGINFVVVLSFFLAELFGAYAYESGPFSLVAILANAQPFMVMFLAWGVVRFLPLHAPREAVTRQSLFVKVGCFLMVFFGLALLGISQ